MQNSTIRNFKFPYFIALFFLLAVFSSYGQVKKTFAPRYNATIQGDVTMIANNMLSAHKTNSFNGTGDNQDSNDRVYVDIDSDNSTFNSSSANLTDPNPGLACKEFIRAYLYWAASDKEAGGVSNNIETWQHNQVKIMLPGETSYTTITADEVLYRGRDEAGHFHNDPYISVKDITDDVLNLSNPYGKYQVANVKATSGGLQPHGGGNYGVAGGWQIVFVYQSTELQTRNITLFDGYAHVDNNQTTDFVVDGFKSIPTGDVKADIILGAIEGDRVLDKDNLQIKKPDNTWQKISTTLRGADNFFNSRITLKGANFVNRNPASTNTLGYDASIFPLNNAGNLLIANNQTSTTLRATSGSESYGLYLLGFSIEVYEPSLGALEFTTSPANSTYNPGDIATLSISIKNSGNDNIRDLVISTTLPDEVEFDATKPLPAGVSYGISGNTLTFTVANGYVDTDDPLFNIDFDVKVKEKCYFLESACSANFVVQATATFKGEINTTPQTTNSSSTKDGCGFGNHDPSVVVVNKPAQVNWTSLANELDRTVSCDDNGTLSDAQELAPTTEFCEFTMNKVSGVFQPASGCGYLGTYTNTWTFTDACGRISDPFTQVITIVDTSPPTFVESLPQNTVAAYNSIPSAATLTASDNCDINASVAFVETYIGDNTSTTYTIVRTWTASDCAGNDTVHTQYIYVTEDGDPIGLKIYDVTVDEADNTADFTVTLTGKVSGGFNVDYNSVNGTAIAPNDFTAIGITSLSFSGNHGEKKTISVSIKEDQFVEDEEIFTIVLSNLSTTEIPINKATGTGTILDNDSATISIADMEINEGAGIFNIQVTLNGKTQDPFTIQYSTADGSAIKVDDYVEAIGQITFPANSTNGSVQNISLEVIDDNIIEFTENFLVNLNSISGFGDISFLDNQANVDIIDNDAITGTGISFDKTNVIVNEDAGTAIFTVRLTGQVFGGFTLDYTTANVTAMAGSDYTLTKGKLYFEGNNNESHTIEVPIIDDTLIEPTETFVVNLSNIDPAIVSINTAQATGTIIDNDATAGTGISFDNTDITVNEDAGTATFTVVLSGNVQGGFTLDYTTNNGSAVQPDDYSLTYDTLTFVGNDGETKEITVPIIDDLLIEPTENFVVDLSNLSTTLIGILTPQANGNILDNDAIAGTGIAFTNTNVTVTEGTDAFAVFEVTLTGDISEDVSVDYTTIDGTAVDPSDYLTTASTITFTPTIKSYEIQVPIIDDAIIEPSEAFTVELSNIQSNLGIGFVDGNTTNTATGNILDDDAVGGTGIAFTNTNVTVTEGTDAFAIFEVTLTGDISENVSVDYTTNNGTAVHPTDYTTTANTITFTPSSKSYDIKVPIIDDAIIEPSEAFTVELSNIQSNLGIGFVDGNTTNTATGNILDDDAVGGTGIAFTNTNVTVTEGTDAFAIFEVTLTGDISENVSVDYTTIDGTAVDPSDYLTTASTITFTPTIKSYEIQVPIIDDAIIEPSEAFTVELSNIQSNLGIGFVDGNTTNTATGNILDDDAVGGTGIAFTNTNVTVTEGTDAFA
ncbi:hypothetical protein HCG49_15825, partial [Arenibacter sp. 6A1]|uniref:Calx-beta domain-containing protein n=1 Tax=Arenibacter sp. 6A1 TaxID=2720391 RepID=UPI0016B06D9B